MATNTKILGVNLNPKKYVLYALQDIYGIGMSLSKKILNSVDLDPYVKVADMSDEDLNKVRSEIESGKYLLEGDLRQKVFKDIARLKVIKCYRGIRHKLGLPVRGQNTRRNARTRKGKAKIPVGGLKKVLQKK